MSNNPDHTRRWLLNVGGAAMLANVLPGGASAAQIATASAAAGNSTETSAADSAAISSVARTLADYVAGTLDRGLPAEVVASTKLHVLDTFAAMVSGRRLRPGEFAARYVEHLGGKPQATVIGTSIVTSTVNAAFANGMFAHADETDDTHPIGPWHVGCGVVPAVLATGELMGRSGNDMLRAVTLGYDVGARLIMALGDSPHNLSCMMNTFAAAAASAAMLRLDSRQVRYAFSYAGQQASGIGYWDRDIQHIEKAFDFGGMGARNGVTAATMVAMGATAVEDPFSGSPNVFNVLGEKPVPSKLVAELGSRFEIFNTTIKKWSVGVPLQSVLDSMTALLQNHSLRPDNVRHITVEVPTGDLHIIDNNPNPDLCVQHLVALMIVDGGATFASVHDLARMHDPGVLAIRKLIEVVPRADLQAATPPHQTIVTIQTADGRSLSQRTSVVRGTARNPMDSQEVTAKALDLMAPVLGAARANELIAALSNLDHIGAVSSLRRLLQG